MTPARDRHRQASELLGAFVLDALDGDEAEMVAHHLDECHRCRNEVDQLAEVAAALGNTAEPPPATLWDRIAEGVAAPEPEVTRHDPSRAAVGATEVAGQLSDLEGRRDEAVLSRLSNREGSRGIARRRRRQGPPARTVAVVGVAAACAALAAVFGVKWSNANGQVGQLQSALARDGVHAAVDAALASPGHRLVELQSPGGTHLVELVVRSNGSGYVVASKMPGLPGDETYQLWAKIAGQPISLGLLGTQPGPGDAFSLGSSVTSAQELMMTVEPAGGVVTPDRGPVATASLS